MNELVTQLKSLSVTLGTWAEDYSLVARDVNDSAERVHTLFRRGKQLQHGKKQDNKQLYQASAVPFFTKLKRD